jgi:Conjugative transposon, TraM
MDRKKKIITIIGSIMFITALSVFIKVMLFPSKELNNEKNKISIMTPEVDDQKISRQSKINKYKQEDPREFEGNQIIKNLGDIENAKKDSTLDSDPFIESNLDKLLMQKKNMEERSILTKKPGRNVNHEEEAINAQLRELMELQNQVGNPSSLQLNEAAQNEILLKNLYSQYGLSPEEIKSIEQLEYMNPKALPLEDKKEVDEKYKSPTQSIVKTQNHFQGAGSIGNTKDVLDLIPAETVDQCIVMNGTTIAIRTKKSILIKNPKVVIPKGSIVYGKVNISTDRLMINIHSYKNNEKLYLLDISLYDFDGREGIHLGNRTWPKIPSKVAKDVYEYAYQKGTQASTFGSGDNTINLEESKDIAILSSAKHIGEEVFEKRKVFMPRKYHLWFNINNE